MNDEMTHQKKVFRFFCFKPLVVFIIVLVIVTVLLLYLLQIKKQGVLSIATQITQQPSPTISSPAPSSFGTYVQPHIPNKSSYRIAMVGDSMTAALGIYGGKLSEYLNTLFHSTPGHQRIIVDNYAIGSTNILDLQKQMSSKLTVGDVTLDPLLSVKPDVILIESFGYNPLSQLGLVEGQKKQIETLQQTMQLISSTLPNTAIIFVATIAPNRETYALQENPGEPFIKRAAEADERSAYIKNHMAFAIVHHIPLIDIYDKSLTQNGDGNSIYINPSDHIHPSFAGIDFIDHEIANFIANSNILPK